MPDLRPVWLTDEEHAELQSLVRDRYLPGHDLGRALRLALDASPPPWLTVTDTGWVVRMVEVTADEIGQHVGVSYSEELEYGPEFGGVLLYRAVPVGEWEKQT